MLSHTHFAKSYRSCLSLEIKKWRDYAVTTTDIGNIGHATFGFSVDHDGEIATGDIEYGDETTT